MGEPDSANGELLNAPQKKHFLVTLKYADQLLSEVENLLHPASSAPLFPRYALDLRPQEVEEITAGIAAFRKQMTAVLQTLGISDASTQIGAMHAIRTNLDYIEMELEELNAQGMRAHGELSPSAVQQVEAILTDLKAVLRPLLDYARQRSKSR